jgi:hypothetical protein
MATDDEVQNALLAIHSRLGTIEGKVNLVARAERESVLHVLQEAVQKDPLLGQIYLLLDGSLSQKDVHERLKQYGIVTSQPTVSRRMTDLVSEFGVADPIGTGAVLRKNKAAEDILNLSRRIRGWLQDGGHAVPEEPRRKPRKV